MVGLFTGIESIDPNGLFLDREVPHHAPRDSREGVVILVYGVNIKSLASPWDWFRLFFTAWLPTCMHAEGRPLGSPSQSQYCVTHRYHSSGVPFPSGGEKHGVRARRFGAFILFRVPFAVSQSMYHLQRHESPVTRWDNATSHIAPFLRACVFLSGILLTGNVLHERWALNPCSWPFSFKPRVHRPHVQLSSLPSYLCPASTWLPQERESSAIRNGWATAEADQPVK